MQMTLLYTFPLLPFLPTFSCTNVLQGPDGFFGFGIKAPPDSPTTEYGTFSFFEIDVMNGSISHHSTSLSPGKMGRVQLCYDREKSLWMIGTERSQILEVYEIRSGRHEPWSLIGSISNKDVRIGDKTLVALWQKHGASHLLFRVADIAEISDACVYEVQWQPLFPTAQPTFQQIAFADVVVPYHTDNGSLVFLCQRVFFEEPLEQDMRHGAGNWQLRIAALEANGTWVQREPLPGITIPIRHPMMPEDDFLTGLTVRMSMTDGPCLRQGKGRTCIAAFVVQEAPQRGSSEHIEVLRQRRADQYQKTSGGLYWVDLQGRLLHYETCELGAHISMCWCGESVVGADIWEGRPRLWRWSPGPETRWQMGESLAPEVRRVTLLAMENQQQAEVPLFWCIEEYAHGMRITQRDAGQLQEQMVVWCEGVTLLEELPEPYLADRKPQGLAVFHDMLLVIVKDEERRLKLFRIQ